MIGEKALRAESRGRGGAPEPHARRGFEQIHLAYAPPYAPVWDPLPCADGNSRKILMLETLN